MGRYVAACVTLARVHCISRQRPANVRARRGRVPYRPLEVQATRVRLFRHFSVLGKSDPLYDPLNQYKRASRQTHVLGARLLRGAIVRYPRSSRVG